MLQNIVNKIVDLKLQGIQNYEGSTNTISVHRLNTGNSGDLKCAPYLYFKELQDINKVDVIGYLSKNIFNSIKWANDIKDSNIILGGGGLFDRPTFNHSIDVLIDLASKGKKVVPWGVGHNNAGMAPTKTYFEQVKGFKLIGVRDYGIKNTDWVPCVSCMNNVFDKTYEPTHEIGVIEHEHIKLNSKNNSDIPTILNNATFEEIISFIGSVEVLITNSYHAMYWGMLMKRKVIVIPNSSKMHSFKYQVPLCDDFNNYEKYLGKTQVYDGLLEECREKNIVFSEKCFDYLGL